MGKYKTIEDTGILSGSIKSFCENNVHIDNSDPTDSLRAEGQRYNQIT